MKVAVTRLFDSRLIFLILLITPLVDTINGIYLLLVGASGLSIGTGFRCIVILYCIMYLVLKKKTEYLFYLCLVYFPALAVIKSFFQAGGLISNLSYAMKWVYIILLILTTCAVMKDNRQDGRKKINNIIWTWSWFVPTSLIVEYSFGVGFNTYYDAGFKGLYYSTNDLAYTLTILFLISLYNCLTIKSWKYFFVSALNSMAILILGTKSSLLFMVSGVCFAFLILFKNSKLSLMKKTLFISLGVLCVGAYSIVFSKEIFMIFNRYINMWEYSSSEQNLMDSLLFFATSGRTGRILSFLDMIPKKLFLPSILFGWIIPDNAHVVEMDLHDLFFQYGLLGFSILMASYYKILVNSIKMNSRFNYVLLVISIIYIILAGHVISGAFSGTMFSIVCILFIEPFAKDKSPYFCIGYDDNAKM